MNGAVEMAIRRYDRRRRNARLVGYSIGIGGVVTGFIVYASLKSAPYHGTFHDVAILAAQSFYIGAPVLGYAAYNRMARREGLLLWLRRFRPSYGRKVKFHRSLGPACAAMLHPVTVQDSSFRASALSAVLRVWILAPLALLLWLVGLFAVMLLVAFPLGIDSDAGVLVLTCGWSLCYGWTGWTVLVRKGFFPVRGGSSAAAVIFRAARAGARGTGVGVEVLKCGNRQWKDVVTQGLQNADIVLLDLTEVTEPLLWELSQALTHVPAERILLSVEEGSKTPGRLHAEIADPVKRLSGQGLTREWIEQAWVEYPAVEAEPLGRRRQYLDLTKRLRWRIAPRMPVGGRLSQPR